MSDANKKWSWKNVLSRAAGPAIGAGAGSAATSFVLTGGLSTPIVVPVVASCTFAGAVLGSVFGYITDDPPSPQEPFGSGLLLTTVVSGVLFTILFLLAGPAINRMDNPLSAIERLSALVGFLSSAFASVIDDVRARKRRELRYNASVSNNIEG